MGRDGGSFFVRDPNRSFNPRARVGRDDGTGMPFRRYVWVSIHAPAWGATLRYGPPLRNMTVSIHAPAWGATVWGALVNPGLLSFNPRARVGRDMVKSSDAMSFIRFNPRARVGRDDASMPDCLAFVCFNPRARVGRDTRGRQ